MRNNNFTYSDQIYWSVVYDQTNGKLMMGQIPLPDSLDYDKRVELVHSFDQRAKQMNFKQIRFGYFTVPAQVDLSEFDDSDDLPF